MLQRNQISCILTEFLERSRGMTACISWLLDRSVKLSVSKNSLEVDEGEPGMPGMPFSDG